MGFQVRMRLLLLVRMSFAVFMAVLVLLLGLVVYAGQQKITWLRNLGIALVFIWGIIGKMAVQEHRPF
jgi:hypothetical protein